MQIPADLQLEPQVRTLQSGPNPKSEPSQVEITTFRYRVLHVAARITRGARQLRLRIDATWRWAAAIAAAWHRVRTAFG